jgi:hypothetical protein
MLKAPNKMAIQRRPKTTSTEQVAAQDAFVAGAPDSGPSAPPATYEKGVPKGNKRQITLTIAPELLRRVDEVAKRSGQARAAVINMAVYRALEGDIFKAN